MILCDTGAIFAADRRDADHHACVDLSPSDVARVAELVAQYDDLPLGTTDASVIALAERLGVDEIATLDQRHFRVVRPRHVDALTLLPEPTR